MRPDMPDRHSVPYSMLRELLQGARKQRLAFEPLLRRIGVDPLDLEKRDARLSLNRFSILLRELWLLMADECSGMLSRPAANGSFAMMTYAALSSSDLGEALHHCCRFMSMMSDDLELALTEEDREASISLCFRNPHNFASGFFILSWYVILIRFGSWLVNRPILIDRISFEFSPPDYAEEIPWMFPAIAMFNQNENRVVFAGDTLNCKIVRDNETLKEFLKNAPENLLTQFRSDDSLTAEIKLLFQQQPSERLNFEQVAGQLHSTTHTLRRRLKKEGTSFQQIKAGVLRTRARQELIYSDSSIAEIANRLGYSESAAFNHAFKQWTGISPGQYRRKFSI